MNRLPGFWARRSCRRWRHSRSEGIQGAWSLALTTDRSFWSLLLISQNLRLTRHTVDATGCVRPGTSADAPPTITTHTIAAKMIFARLTISLPPFTAMTHHAHQRDTCLRLAFAYALCSATELLAKLSESTLPAGPVRENLSILQNLAVLPWWREKCGVRQIDEPHHRFFPTLLTFSLS